MRSETTLKDLARLANVSVNTISRALNDRSGVHPETKARIMELAKEHHYRPNIMARTMRGIESNMIGTLVGDITDNFFIQILSGVEEEVAREGMPIIIGNTGEDLKKQKANLDLLLSYGCKNFVITPVSADPAFINILRQEGVNFVIADRTIPEARDCDQVSINNRRDALRATEYLIQCGHRRIAVLNQRSAIRTETDRTEGYLEALSTHGIPARTEYILNARDADAAGRDIRRLLEMEERPTALFIAKDTLSLSAVSAIGACGLDIPGDISVFIYGSPEWSQALRPHFTCMDRAVKEIGRTAARILVGKLQGNETAAPVNIQYDSNLVIRDSVRLV